MARYKIQKHIDVEFQLLPGSVENRGVYFISSFTALFKFVIFHSAVGSRNDDDEDYEDVGEDEGNDVDEDDNNDRTFSFDEDSSSSSSDGIKKVTFPLLGYVHKMSFPSVFIFNSHLLGISQGKPFPFWYAAKTFENDIQCTWP